MSAKIQGLYKSVETLWVKHNQLDTRVVALEKQVDHLLIHTLNEGSACFDNSLAARIAALEADNAALESKAGDEAYVNNLRADNRKMALSNAGMTMKIAELERQLMAYRDCANCAESSPPTKRQQVAEKFLAAAVGEFGYAACADWLYQSAPRVHSSDPDAHDRLVAMGRLLEQAAREEQDA